MDEELNLVSDPTGKIDRETSEYKTIGGGGFPGLAPDNSQRMFRLDGGHKPIKVTDADGANPRKMDVTEMPGVGDKGKQVWLTRWSTYPRYLSLMGPDGDDARMRLGNLDAKLFYGKSETAPGAFPQGGGISCGIASLPAGGETRAVVLGIRPGPRRGWRRGRGRGLGVGSN